MPASTAVADVRLYAGCLDKVIAVDLNGVFYCCRAVVPPCGARLWTLNVASIAGKEGTVASRLTADKAGHRLRKALGASSHHRRDGEQLTR